MSPDEQKRDAANARVRRWEDRALALKARQDAAGYEQEKEELFGEMVRVLRYRYCFALTPLAVARLPRFEASPQPPLHHHQLHGRNVPREGRKPRHHIWEVLQDVRLRAGGGERCRGARSEVSGGGGCED